MSKTIIQIGYPKTATTWFNNYFFPKISNANVIFYDNISFDISENNERFEIVNFHPPVEKELLLVATNSFAGLVKGRWENGKYRFLFIKNLKERFPDAEIVVFLRNQLDFLASLYSSYLKRGGTYKIEDLFSAEHLADGKFFSYEYLNYYKLIKLYQEHFGENKIHVFIYEEFLENNQVFLKNYSEQLGYDVDLENLFYRKANEKLRKGLASFVRHSNMLLKSGPVPKKNIIDIPWIYKLINNRIDSMNSCVLWGNKVERDKVLGTKLAAIIYEFCKESNNQLVEQFGLESLKKFGYPL
jgi:hypothetical protein